MSPLKLNSGPPTKREREKWRKWGYFLAVVFVVMGTIVTLAANITNFPVMLTHGPSQYVANILHGHKDLYCTAEQPIDLHEDIETQDASNRGEQIQRLEKGDRFAIRGYRDKDTITWLATAFIKNEEISYAYCRIPKKAKDLSISSFINGWNPLASNPVANEFFEELPRDVGRSYKDNIISRENFFLTFMGTWYFRLGLVIAGILSLICWILGKKGNHVRATNSQNKVRAQQQVTSLGLSRRMHVRTVKEKFKDTFGADIQIYTTSKVGRGSKKADDNAALGSLRDTKRKLKYLRIDSQKAVGEIEELFREHTGIGIRILKPGVGEPLDKDMPLASAAGED